MSYGDKYDNATDKLHELKNEFYEAFSKLCNDYVKKGREITASLLPMDQEQLDDQFEMQLRKTTSFYGRKDDANPKD